MPRTPFSFLFTRNGFLLALLLAFLCSHAIVAPSAQAQTEPEGPRRGYDIPSGSLEDALNRFARRAGITLSFDPAQVAGRSTTSLQGEFTVQEGLAALLTPHQLRAVRATDGSYSLQLLPKSSAVPIPVPAPSQLVDGRLQSPKEAQETQMPLVSVEDAAERDRAPGVTEGSGSYTTPSMDTATRLPLSMRQTPQSVSVVTRDRMDEQGILSLDDAIEHIPGLTVQKSLFTTNETSSFIARGFALDNIMYDGMVSGLHGAGGVAADNGDMAIYDRVEVVRGATGLTQGAGTPSAAINLVRKRPTEAPLMAVSIGAGSWNNYRAEIDVSHALNESGTVRGRMVAVYQDNDSFIDTVNNNNQLLYGILELDLASSTTLTVGGSIRDYHTHGTDGGLPTYSDGRFLPIPRSTYLGTDFDFWDQDSSDVFGELEHRFDGGWRAKLAALKKRTRVDMMQSSLHRVGTETLYHNNQAYPYEDDQEGFDVSASGPLNLLGRVHELVVGASHNTRSVYSYGGWSADAWTAAAPVVDPFNWDPGSVTPPELDYSLWKSDSEIEQYAAYATGRFSLANPLSVIVGARLDWYDYSSVSYNSSYKIDGHVTPYAGVVYDLDAQHSVYASWTEIFQPQRNIDATGNVLEPITGTNYEAGIKGEYFGGRLNAGISVFLTEQQNRPMDDLNDPNPCPGTTFGFCKRAAGEVKSEGVELEISGALTPGWQVAAGYSYVWTTFVEDTDPANVGKLFDSDVPRHQLKLSTVYQLPGELNRWRIGGTLYAQDAIFNEAPGWYRIEQDAYAVVDFLLGYRYDRHIGVNLNVNNVLDEDYYQSIGWPEGGNVPGAPRNVMLTLKWTL